MASRHDIIHIDFQANAGKANVALQALQSEAEKARQKVEGLRTQLQNARNTNMPIADIQKLEAELKKASSEAKQWQSALNNNMKGVRALDEAIKMFNKGKGTVEDMNAALSKTALNAAQLQKSRSADGSKQWKEMDALIVALQQNIAKCNTATNQLISTIKSGGTASIDTLTKAKSDLQQMIALEEQGSNGWRKYSAQLKVVEGELNRLAAEEQRMAAQNVMAKVFNGQYVTKTRGELERMIATLRQYQSSIADPEGKGARHFKATERAIKSLNDQLAKSKELSATQILGNMGNFGVEQIRQATQQMTQLRDAFHEGTAEWNKYNALVKQGDAYLQQYAEREKIARGEAISLADALKLSSTAGTSGFSGTAQQLQLAQQAIERAIVTTDKGTDKYQKLQQALARVKAEMSGAGISSQRMQEILANPKAEKSVDVLKNAVARARAEMDVMGQRVERMQRLLRQAEASGKTAWADRLRESLRLTTKQMEQMAAATKQADQAQKQLAATSKGSATAFEKAWSRLKTYITLYMGAAVAIQKIVSTMGDLMELSDKMGEVRKTTGFTADEVGRLSDNLAKLDTRTNLATLMSTAAKAGQLGLKTQQDIEGFTKAANMMMVALPEMGDQAATEIMKVAIATGEVKKIQEQMSQGLIEGTSATEVAMTKVASTIDQLRANSAAAAPAITDFVKRVGAVGAQSGISIDQVAALGATVDALGMRVEMSATALSRMIPAIKNNAYKLGDIIGKTEEDIKRRFATGEGMSVILDVFKAIRERSGITAKDVENDAEGAADKVEKLMEAAGFQDVIKVLNQQGARAGIVFAGLSQNIEELEKNLATASVAYEENIAIMNEYNKMNDTTAAKWERLKNEVEEFFVTAGNSRGLGYFIDTLRWFVNLLTGNVGPALKAVSGLLKTFIVYWSVLKVGLGEAIFVKAINGLKAMYLGLTGLVANTKKSIIYSRLLSQAQKELKVATDATSVALAKQKIAAIEARMAQEGLNKSMNANIWMALAAAIGMAIYYIVTWEKELTSAERAIADMNTKIDEEKDKLDNLHNAYKEAEGNTNKRKVLMEEMNKSYGKYLGFLLTDAENTNLMAMAHERAADAIEREILMREKEQGISSIRQEMKEDLVKDWSKFTEFLRKIKLTSEEIGEVQIEVQNILKTIKYNDAEGAFVFPTNTDKIINEYLKSRGAETTFEELNTEEVIATLVNKRLAEILPKVNKATIDYVTGVGNGASKSWGRSYIRGDFAGNYVKTYMDLIEQIGKYENEVNGQIAASDKKRSEDTKGHVETLKKAADEATKVITDNNSTSEQIAKAYESLATAINGLKAISEDLKNNPIEITVPYKVQAITASDVDNVLTSAPWNNAKIDQNRLQQEMNRQQTQLTINTGTNTHNTSGGGGGGGGGRGGYGNYNKRVDPYEQWDAEALVARRKEMLERVRRLAGGANVQEVLSMDKKFMDEATRKGIKDMRSAIAWYNEERLKIQEELHSRNLTNEGQWQDPKKTRGRKRKPKTPESEEAIAELDRYYLERKEMIEEARVNEEMTEAEYNRRIDALEQEHLQKRSDLRKTFTSDDKQFIQQFRQWWASVEDLDTVSWETIEAEWKAAWQRDRAYNNRAMQKDLVDMRAIVVKQLKEIEAIIDKERPFNGITKNLQENLTKMGIMFMDGVEGTMEESVKRTTFLLKEAENAYELTWEQLEKDMRDNGLGAWADAIAGSENAEKAKRAMLNALHTVYDDVQDAIKKEASQVKKQVDITWNDAVLPNGKSIKQTYESAISALGVAQGRVSRANSLIGAGQASERVADKLAIKQMQVQLRMQEHYYNLIRKTGLQRIDDLKRQAEEQRKLNNLAEAERLELDAKHATMSLNLSLTKEQTDIDKQREDIIARTEESQARLYKELREWGDLIASSLRSVMEASNAGNAEYYNELAKLNLTGKGGPGAGTYIVIENEGTEDAKAHYEYLDERAALERQREIEQQNAQADAWKKVMDDINQKMNDMITDQLNAMMQNASLDANTQELQKVQTELGNEQAKIEGNIEALGTNTDAMNTLTYSMNNLAGVIAGNGASETPGSAGTEGGTVGSSDAFTPPAQYGFNSEEYANAYAEHFGLVKKASDAATETMVNNNKKMTTSTQSAFAKMIQATNLYGTAYQVMSNDNLDATQKFELFAVQAAGNAAIAMLTTNMAQTEGEAATQLPGILGKAASQLGPIAGPIAFAALSALLGGLMGLAVSKIAKSKSTIAQATGASVSAGRLSTGMLTYAEGNVNEFTDPNSLTPGRSYNVDGADGKTYRARYMGVNAKTHITNGPEFHLVGEKGREAIIDAHTTRNIQMNEPEIWRTIQTLYNGGSMSALRRRRGRGVRAFADGNVDDFETYGSNEANDSYGGMAAEQMAAFQSSLDRNSEVLERALREGFKGVFDVYGKGGLVDSYDTGKKNVTRHGERY